MRLGIDPLVFLLCIACSHRLPILLLRKPNDHTNFKDGYIEAPRGAITCPGHRAGGSQG